MTSETSGAGNALVLRGEDGTCYAIPVGDLERYRIPAEQQAQVLAAAGGEDTAGFAHPGGTPPGLRGYEGSPGHQGGGKVHHNTIVVIGFAPYFPIREANGGLSRA